MIKKENLAKQNIISISYLISQNYGTYNSIVNKNLLNVYCSYIRELKSDFSKSVFDEILNKIFNDLPENSLLYIVDQIINSECSDSLPVEWWIKVINNYQFTSMIRNFHDQDFITNIKVLSELI